MTHFSPLPNTRSRALLVLLGVCLGMASGCFKTKQVLEADMSDGGAHMADEHPTKKHDAGAGVATSGDSTSPARPDGGSSGSMSSPGFTALDGLCPPASLCVALNNVDKVDLLFVIDNSNSMKEEQAKLRTQFGPLITTLTTGKGEDFKFTPASLHLGVVSTDMGLPGVLKVDKCMGLGQDGLLLHTPTSDPMVPGCQAQYPTFLSVEPGDSAAQQAALDFTCIASLGTDGCGFEQQLEAGLKAVWPSTDDRIMFLADPAVEDPMGLGFTPGHGDTDNKDFLRDGDGSNPSLLAVVVVSDEDDGSFKSVEHLIPKQFLDPNDQRYNEPLNLRNFYHKDELYPLTRYTIGLKALRPNDENLVVFGAIAGVPAEALKAVGTEDVGTNPMVRQAFYDRVLADPLMQEMVDPASMSVPGQGNLLPSCSTTDGSGTPNGKAYPAQRLVQVAQGFGANGFIDSICATDFKPAIDQLIDRIGARLGSGCLDEGLPREDNGLVPDCKVLWDLGNNLFLHGIPANCNDGDFLKPANGRSDDRLCEVTQLPVFDGKVGPESSMMGQNGWYYDDFSDESGLCMRSQRRIGFTKDATPPAGVHAILSCK